MDTNVQQTLLSVPSEPPGMDFHAKVQVNVSMDFTSMDKNVSQFLKHAQLVWSGRTVNVFQSTINVLKVPTGMALHASQINISVLQEHTGMATHVFP